MHFADDMMPSQDTDIAFSTRAVPFNHADCWAVHDCLASALAGFSGRAENAEPWHATNLMAKLAYAIPRFAPPHPVDEVLLDLTLGEMQCVQYNVPRASYQGAQALLLRIFHAMAEMAFHQTILPENPQESPEQRQRLDEWIGYFPTLTGKEDGSDG